MEADKLGVQKAGQVANFTPQEEMLWKQFSRGDNNVYEFSRLWLGLQCARIVSVSEACVVLRVEEKFKAVATWPDVAGKDRKSPTEVLAQVAESALREQKSVVLPGQDGRHQIAYPIRIDGNVVGIVALQVGKVSPRELTGIIRQMQWGLVWFENYFHKQNLEAQEQSHQRIVSSFKISTLCLDYSEFQSAAAAVATEWAGMLGCDRVSVGFLEGKSCRISALSHDMDFDKRTNGIRLLGNAMDEAIDQKEPVRLPAETADKSITLAHRKLIEHSGNKSCLTVLLSASASDADIQSRKSNGSPEILGAVTLEHHETGFFTEEKIKLCENVALLVGPMLFLRKMEQRWIATKMLDSASGQLKKVFGAGYFQTKLILALLAAFTVWMSFASSDYRVTAEATIEGWTQRHISAPIDGYVASSSVKAGDVVKQGQVLFSLDNRDLQLEQKKWSYKQSQIEKQHLEALVQQDFTQAGILTGQLAQANAQLALIREQLLRTEVRAPFDAVLVSGDLTQNLGAPVTRGESLMRVAQLDGYRLILEVDERDIAAIAIGQEGEMSLASLNSETFSFVVTKLTPVATARDGSTHFRVEAKLNESSGQLRPGMTGAAKVMVGERSLWWVLTHKLSDWLTLSLWRWLP